MIKMKNYLFDENNLKQSCYEEFIEGERCWSSLPQFSATHTNIEQTLSKLYPQYAKDTDAKDLNSFSLFGAYVYSRPKNRKYYRCNF